MVKDGKSGEDWHGYKQQNWNIKAKFFKPFNLDAAPIIIGIVY